MLAGLGWPFAVREPAELRAEVRSLAARLAAWGAEDGREGDGREEGGREEGGREDGGPPA
jgi:hypothetical protein